MQCGTALVGETMTTQLQTPLELDTLRQALENRLAQLLPQAGNERDLVARAMRESTLAPGKRMRPLLLVLAARGLGHQGEQALDLGCAIEMVHAASLVLDDMPCMDDACLRRGLPTTHLKFGQDVAILAAVALLSRAFGVVAAIAELPGGLRAQLVATLANAVGMQGLVRGQFQDLRDGASPRSADDIALTNDLKTGVLFGAVLEMAALLGGADESTRSLLQGFALELGQAFQLYDDLLDNCAESAKDIGKDAGKSTFMTLLGEDKVRERLRAHVDRALAYLSQVYAEDQAINRYVRGMFAKATAG
jgi:geranylgeranyl diphosphate synthase type II